MLTIVSIFLFVSVFLYTLLGGADYGIGIIELYSSTKNRDKTKKAAYRVIGPVWEVNHIWLIITIVILWVGFPAIFNVIMIHLHIPITLALLGIISRGVAFVFRHYDAVLDKSQDVYDRIFEWSSVLTPMVLGVCFGSLLAGEIPVGEDLNSNSFYDLYIAPRFLHIAI
jgi:cytochrome d ubiquinol oxidase subunit II